MRSVVIIVAGLVLLGLFVLGGRLIGGGAIQTMVTAVKIFLPLWFVVAAINMWMGVSGAGYSVAEEFPIFLAIFALPAIAAGIIWWKFS
jgi:hypothetical protein